jgi:hypothetical protein
MGVHLADFNVAHQIAGRIRALIARQDHGDVTAAARRLDLPIADVYLPERVICSGDEPALEFLATVVRSYDADVCWLITGTTARNARHARPFSTEARLTIVEVLGELSDRLLDDVRSERDTTRPTTH